MAHNSQHRDRADCARCNNPEWYLEISQVELDPQDCGLCSDCCALIDSEFEELFSTL